MALLIYSITLFLYLLLYIVIIVPDLNIEEWNIGLECSKKHNFFYVKFLLRTLHFISYTHKRFIKCLIRLLVLVLCQFIERGWIIAPSGDQPWVLALQLLVAWTEATVKWNSR